MAIPQQGRFADDEALWRAMLEHEDSAWCELHRRYHARLLHRAERLLPDHLDPENAVAETWLRALGHAHGLRSPSTLFPWLSTILRNVCASQGRHHAVQESALSRLARPATFEPQWPAEIKSGVVALLRPLSRTHRRVMALRFLWGLPVDAIALRLGLSRCAVQHALRRGLARARQVGTDMGCTSVTRRADEFRPTK